MNEDDDFFDQIQIDIDDGSDSVENENSSSKNLAPNVSREEFFVENKIPDLIGVDYPEPFRKIVDYVRQGYTRWTYISTDEVQEEIKELESDVKVQTNVGDTTLQMINSQMGKVQAAKDRLSTIYGQISATYNYRKRMVEMLRSAWGNYAVGKTKDLRDADGTLRLSEFMQDLAEIESLNQLCINISKNLDSLHHTLSRQITIFQLQISLRDLGRSGLPDYKFPEDNEDQNSQDIDEILNGNISGESIEAEESSF